VAKEGYKEHEVIIRGKGALLEKIYNSEQKLLRKNGGRKAFVTQLCFT
jgi:hypothetical protein